jgi:hypothetical protein
MSLTASYNTVSLDPLLTWSEEVTAVTQEGRVLSGYRHVFKLTGYLSASTVAARATNIASLLSKLREAGKTLAIVQDSTTIRSLAATDCRGDGPIPSFEVPGEDKLKLGFLTPFTLTIQAQTDATGGAGGVTSDTYDDTYAWDKQLRRTITRRGNLTTDSSTSASGKFASKDPVASLPSGTSWELDRKEYNVDDDDQTLDYSYVYVEQHLANPTTAKDVSWTLAAAIENGMERWTGSGTLKFERGTAIDRTQIKTVLKSAGLPTDAKIEREDITEDKRENTLTFTVTAMRGYGSNATVEYEQSVETVTVPGIADFKAIDQGGKDVRQVITRPEVTVTQSGRHVQQNAYPGFPTRILQDPDLVEVRETYEPVRFDTAGNRMLYPIRWTYVYRPLNQVTTNQIASPYASPTTNPLSGQTSSQKAA